MRQLLSSWRMPFAAGGSGILPHEPPVLLNRTDGFGKRRPRYRTAVFPKPTDGRAINKCCGADMLDSCETG